MSTTFETGSHLCGAIVDAALGDEVKDLGEKVKVGDAQLRELSRLAVDEQRLQPVRVVRYRLDAVAARMITRRALLRIYHHGRSGDILAGLECSMLNSLQATITTSLRLMPL